MTAKQFLYSVRDEQKEIEEIGDRIYELEMSGMWSSRTSMKKMNRGGGEGEWEKMI